MPLGVFTSSVMTCMPLTYFVGSSFPGAGPLGRLPSQPWELGQPAGPELDQWLSAFRLTWKK